MSTYCTISGSIYYETDKDFNRAIDLLTNGGWMKDGWMVDEMDQKMSETLDVDFSGKAINIPMFHYHNLGGLLSQLFTGGKGEVVWTCTDGDFQGGVIVDGQETLYNLANWAEENMEDNTPPEDAGELCEWMQQVEQEFFEEMS